MTEKLLLDDNDIQDMIGKLLEQIKASNDNFDIVVGIENGGLYVSRPLAEALNLPHASVRISRYDGDKLRRTMIVENNGFRPEGRACLIADDLIQDGETILAYQRNFGTGDGDQMAVLLWSPLAVIQPKFYARLKPKKWIVFPWEVSDGS